MTEKILFISILVSFLTTLLILPVWIVRAKSIGLIWEDVHKIGRPKNVAGSGGLAVLMGFTLGVLSYIAIKTFFLFTDITTIRIFALITTVLIAGVVGLVDDFLGWLQGGMSAKFRILMMLFAAVPLMVINAGAAHVNVPLIGLVDFGLYFSLIIVPLGIIATSTTFNILAGYNGLEASQGIIFLSAMAFVTFMTGDTWLSLIALCMVACLCAFFIFNKNPASVFPGDSLTYAVGALIGVIAILGNIERVSIFFFIPYILQVGLKTRGGLKKHSFGRLNEDGSLDVPYDKFYGLEHIAIALLKKFKKNGKAYEREVVWVINCFQIVIILIGLFLFRSYIFI